MAMINAFAMTPPAYSLEIRFWPAILNTESKGEIVVLHLWYLVCLILPLAMVYAAAVLAQTIRTGKCHQAQSADHVLRLHIRTAWLGDLDRPLSIPLLDRRHDASARESRYSLASTLGWPYYGEPNWRLAQATGSAHSTDSGTPTR